MTNVDEWDIDESRVDGDGVIHDEPVDDEPVEPELYYPTLEKFYTEYLRTTYQRVIDGTHRVWSGRWWENAEATVRLNALWRAWEALRHDPEFGMSVWFRDHADIHMAILMDPAGPFKGVMVNDEEITCGKGEPLPHVSPPAGLLDGL